MATTTSRLALTKPAGTDSVDIAVLNGNADKIDAAIGAKICTSGTRPSTPYDGQVIYETDTSKAFVYIATSSTWAATVPAVVPTAETANNALKVGGRTIYVQATAPTSGMVAGDLLFWGS